MSPILPSPRALAWANQYLDYWTYDPKNAKYHSLGDFPRLNASPADNTLTANVRLNAAAYQTQKYFLRQRQVDTQALTA